RTTGEFFRSEDKGGTFTKVSEPGKSNDKKFRAIPGYEGDLWLPIAERNETGDPVTGKLLHSTDGGKSWTPAEGIGYCEAVGYGKSKTAGGYPAIYAFGKVGETVGVFGSDDAGKTWARVNDDGHEYGGLANGEFVIGDMNTYGVVYMSTAGRGIAVRVPSDWNMGSSNSGGTTVVKAQPKGTFANPTASVKYVGGNLELHLESANVRVSVFDMHGREISSKRYSSSVTLPLKQIVPARGNYLVRVDDGKRLLFNNRVIVTR
ncbi:MAG: T9SS type A sorting domain-containing protein, partial [Fibrobacter sp.]|nr:T9SS type A sorting domain-containing protein [Fibrobacter sp.]